VTYRGTPGALFRPCLPMPWWVRINHAVTHTQLHQTIERHQNRIAAPLPRLTVSQIDSPL
jgi:hypothetical protein